jgi:hypothetical protein
MGKEQLTGPVQRFEFEDLKQGDLVHITTGIDNDAFRYEFQVEETSTLWPKGTLKEIKPDGSEVGPFPFSMHGCGHWTTRAQNPVQDQPRAFTPYYEGLIVGRFFWGAMPGDRERLTFDKPGQEISAIEIISNT